MSPSVYPKPAPRTRSRAGVTLEIAQSTPSTQSAMAVDLPAVAFGGAYLFCPGDEALHADALRAAHTDSPLLIMGEPGTGKTALARFVHEQSARRSGRLVEHHCDARRGAQEAEQIFGSRGHRAEAASGGVLQEAENGTLLIAGFERSASSLRDRLLAYLDASEPGAQGPGASLRARLILAGNQDTRTHLDRPLWDRLVAWPPVLLAPLRLQRRKKWHLFRKFVEVLLAGEGAPPPQTADFLLYALVVSYGWPGNARQLRDFACHLVGSGQYRDRHLAFDDLCSFFDVAEAFSRDDVTAAQALVHGDVTVFGNRVQRDFARALRALQSNDSGRAWLEVCKASPHPAGPWAYPRIRWQDPHFDGAEMCSRVGQMHDTALAGLGEWHERLPASSLIYKTGELPWEASATAATVSGRSGGQLAQDVAYALLTGEIPGRAAFDLQVVKALEELAPNLSAAERKKLGVTRTKASPRPRRRKAS